MIGRSAKNNDHIGILAVMINLFLSDNKYLTVNSIIYLFILYVLIWW